MELAPPNYRLKLLVPTRILHMLRRSSTLFVRPLWPLGFPIPEGGG